MGYGSSSMQLPLASKKQQPFPPVYPFPTSGPAYAVIVGVFQRSPSPYSAGPKRKRKETDEKQRKKKQQKTNNLAF